MSDHSDLDKGFAVAKLVAHGVASWGTSKVVKDLLVHNLPAPDSRKDSLRIWIGSGLIGSMATTAAKRHVDGQINGMRRHVIRVKEMWEEEKKPK